MLWSWGAVVMKPADQLTRYPMAVETPGLPSFMKRWSMYWPMCPSLATLIGSKWRLSGSMGGGTQIRPGKGPVW